MAAINPPKIEIKTDGTKTVVKINGEENKQSQRGFVQTRTWRCSDSSN